MFYRMKQFYWAVNSKLKNNDISFIKNNLNKIELQLFYKLSKPEQKHSIRVAYDVKLMCNNLNIDEKILIKAAILHDIGKIYQKLNVVDKSFMVIADSLSKGAIKKLDYIRKVNVYYNHAFIGYQILKTFYYDDKLLFLVKNHHNKAIKNNLYLNILKICDDKN